MSITKIITDKLEVEPKYLTKDILSHIKERIEKKYTNFCDKEGYILSINEILSYKENIISRMTANTFFIINFKANVLKPQVGKPIKCNIEMIFHHGIFAGLERLKVLIPFTSMKTYIYDEKESSVKYNNKIYKKDDTITVKISELRYENKNFSCIGTLI